VIMMSESREGFYDSLTGLPTRQLFEDRVEHALARSLRQHQKPLVLMVLDLDRFAMVNESLGHAAGDELLEAVAARLRDTLRPADTVARVGGDEFAVLLEEVTEASVAIVVADRVRTALELPFEFGAWRAFLTASVGITVQMEASQDASVLLREAYTAMRRARTDGTGKCCVFQGTMHAQALRLMQIDADLRVALERNEFLLHYQPTFSLLTGLITGVEALLRWQHPVYGLLMPDDFIAVAERSAVIEPLGLWVLREATRQMREWRACGAHDLTLSVNLSPRQLLHPDLLDVVRGVLAEAGMPATALRLEITERTLLEDSALEVLQSLAVLGIDVALDDFGTGYCSLAYLQSFPIHCLKIDRSFVQRLDVDPRDREIVRAIIDLGRNLGLSVVAEGVETAAQLVELLQLNCRNAQGFLFARPITGHEFCSLLRAEQLN
jgi:diguanylate cyclase (GGDEF)-like protein